MNTVWSKYIQGINTLYLSRTLRFHDRFRDRYIELFNLDTNKPLKILEIGCGPGALSGALARWYPNATVTGIDRDDAFIEFAGQTEPAADFLVGDATGLPFADGTFDVTISHTVSEHVDPRYFYPEQLRVLKPGGVCLVLSCRKNIHAPAPCTAPSAQETAFWKKGDAHYDDSSISDLIGKFAADEAQLPLTMEEYGFRHIATGYVTVALTPDHPSVSRDLAYDMIVADKAMELENVQKVADALPDAFTAADVEATLTAIREKYDNRLALYDAGDRQWDTAVSVIMVVRGEK